MNNRVLKPIAYFSKKLILAEYNYIIYNKKLLAIVKNLEMWYLKLVSTTNQVKIDTNHKNLKYFITIQQLN